MPATTYALNKILNYNFDTRAFTPPTAFWVGLSLAVCTSASTGSADTAINALGYSYARVSYTNNAGTDTNWTTSSVGTLSNKIAITFPESTGAWGEIKSIFLADSTTEGAGNILWYYNFSPTFTIGTGTTATFAVGSIIVSMT